MRGLLVKDLLEILLQGQELNDGELDRIFDLMLNGSLAEAQIAAFLTVWRLRGETPRELIAGAKALRSRAISIELPPGLGPLLDNCGTGGDGSNSFNISTAAAIIAASCGVRVAKHGNRSVSSKCGSADLLFAAGLPENLRPELAARLLTATGFTFFFAPAYHQAIKQVMPVRRALGVRTIFNLLGPLANPVRPEHQLVGVSNKTYLRPMAEALQALGVKRAATLHARDGLDEISPAATTDLIVLKDGELSSMEIEPKRFSLSASLDDLRGGDAAENLAILWRVLGGEASGVANAVVLNAGAALFIGGAATTVEECMQLAKDQQRSGKTKQYFENWISIARREGPTK